MPHVNVVLALRSTHKPYLRDTMDSDADWAASALFSPSKARIAQAQARDWGFVDSWLAKRYSTLR